MSQRPTSADVIQRYPGPVVLLPERRKWQIILAFNMLFVLAGLMMALQGNRHGVYIALGFGLIAIVPAMVALPGAAKLVLEHDGFTATSLYRGGKTLWTDVSEFKVATLSPGNHRILVYDDARAAAQSHLMAKTQVAGHTSALPDSYGLGADDLAAVMNEWRERALRG